MIDLAQIPSGAIRRVDLADVLDGMVSRLNPENVIVPGFRSLFAFSGLDMCMKGVVYARP